MRPFGTFMRHFRVLDGLFGMFEADLVVALLMMFRRRMMGLGGFGVGFGGLFVTAGCGHG